MIGKRSIVITITIPGSVFPMAVLCLKSRIFGMTNHPIRPLNPVRGSAMLSDRESQILATLSLLRFMTTGQIHRLHGYMGDYGLKVTRRLLGKLVQEGLIHAWQPSKYHQKIHYLTKLGAKTLEYYFGWDHVPTYRKSGKTVHQTYVSEIYVALKTMVPGTSWHFCLNKKYRDVVPDASVYFEPDNRPYLALFEVDMGNESLLYLRDVKLERYARSFARIAAPAGGRSILFLTAGENRKIALGRLAESFPLPISVFLMDEIAMRPEVLGHVGISESPEPSSNPGRRLGTDLADLSAESIPEELPDDPRKSVPPQGANLPGKNAAPAGRD